MDTFMFADPVDRHDIGMVEPGSCLRLAAKSGQLVLLGDGMLGKHLDRHAPAKRLLHRLVNDAHSAAAEFANDSKVAEALEFRRFESGSALPVAAAGPRCRARRGRR